MTMTPAFHRTAPSALAAPRVLTGGSTPRVRPPSKATREPKSCSGAKTSPNLTPQQDYHSRLSPDSPVGVGGATSRHRWSHPRVRPPSKANREPKPCSGAKTSPNMTPQLDYHSRLGLAQRRTAPDSRDGTRPRPYPTITPSQPQPAHFWAPHLTRQTGTPTAAVTLRGRWTKRRAQGWVGGNTTARTANHSACQRLARRTGSCTCATQVSGTRTARLSVCVAIATSGRPSAICLPSQPRGRR